MSAAGWFMIAVGALVVAAVRKASAATPARGPQRAVVWPGAGVDDAEYLARILMIESAGGAVPEWSAIAWVAVNRARRGQSSVRSVVAVPGWFGSGAAAEEAARRVSARHGERIGGRTAPPDYAEFPEALDLATAILAGRVPSPIGDRRHFVHPQILPVCTEPTGTAVGSRICVDGRLFPSWSVSQAAGGRADYEPMRVGRAVFS